MAYFSNDSIMTAYFARMQPPGVAEANIFAKTPICSVTVCHGPKYYSD